MYDVAVIIINYNTSKYTLECIESVIEKTSQKISFQIIVVDNNSEANDFNNLKNNYPVRPNVSLQRSIINTGFGGGNMFGVQFAKAKYLLFLNNDALLLNDCLSILYKYMEGNTNIGVSTAQNYDENENHVISFDHYKGLRKLILGRSFLEKSNPKKFPKRKKKYSKPVTVNFVNGAFMFFRGDVFAKTGGFDTNIFLYFEEMDICFRMQKLGFFSALNPEAKILHFQGVSTGMSKNISKEGLISYMYIIKKNFSYIKYLIIRLYYNISFIIKPKKWHLLSLILKGAPLSESLKQKQKVRF